MWSMCCFHFLKMWICLDVLLFDDLLMFSAAFYFVCVGSVTLHLRYGSTVVNMCK